MRNTISLLMLLLMTSLSAQESQSYVYQLTVLDAQTMRPIHEVQTRYRCGTASAIVFTNEAGSIAMSCSEERFNAVLIHEFYQPQTDVWLRSDRALKRSGDTLFFQVYMQPKPEYTKGEVVINNPYKPQEIFSSERISVADFELLDDGNMLLLVYERKLNKGAELLVVDMNQKVLFARNVGADAMHLFRDFRGLIHLMYKSRLDYVYIEDEMFDLVPMDKEYYLRFVAPIIDTNVTKFYFTNYRETYPAAEFFVYDALDSTYAKISRVSDEIMMEMFETEYLWVDTRTKLWARQMEQKSGIPKEDIVGEVIFTQSIFYKPIYAPFFMRNDSIYLFDFYKDMMRVYDREGHPLDSMAISMHKNEKKTGWSNRLIQDEVTGIIYAIFDKGGYTVIRAVDLSTGNLCNPIRLDFRYVEKLVIHDNAIYYTYRPYESNQKKYLYRQLLPTFFGEGETARDGRR
jgi:hypothetical protein